MRDEFTKARGVFILFGLFTLLIFAVVMYGEAKHLDQRTPSRSIVGLAHAHWHKGEYNKALYYFELALAKNYWPNNTNGYKRALTMLNYGVTLCIVGEYKKGLYWMREAYRVNPKSKILTKKVQKHLAEVVAMMKERGVDLKEIGVLK